MHVVSVPVNLFSFLFHPLCGSFHVRGGRPTKVATVTVVNGEAPSDITKGRWLTGAPCFGTHILRSSAGNRSQGRTSLILGGNSLFWLNLPILIEITMGSEGKSRCLIIWDLKKHVFDIFILFSHVFFSHLKIQCFFPLFALLIALVCRSWI